MIVTERVRPQRERIAKAPAGQNSRLRGAIGRAYVALFTLAPLPLLFHRPFVERVILPMLSAFGV